MQVTAKEQPDSAGISVLNQSGIAAYPSIKGSDNLDFLKALTVIEALAKKLINMARIASGKFTCFVEGVDLGVESIL